MKPSSAELEKHNYQLDGNNRLWRYVTELFPPQTDIEKYVYVTQLAQARLVTRYVEHLRAHNSVNRGVLFWQLNDCCPAISWSAIDCLDRPKALYYYLKRAFADVILAVVPEYEKALANVQPKIAALAAVILNDSAAPVTATLHCTLLDLRADTLDALKMPVSVAPGKTSSPFKLPRALALPERPQSSALRLSLEKDGRILAQKLFLYLPDKYVEFHSSAVSAAVRRIDPHNCELTLTTDTLAKDVQVISDAPVHLSDNFFDVLPSKPAHLTVTAEDSDPADLAFTFLSAADVV
jgi:beta-mannosidase